MINPYMNFGLGCPIGPFFPPLGPGPAIRRRPRVPLLDRQGIFEICTTGIVEGAAGDAAATVDYGVNPCVWNALPCECVAVWKVRHSATAAGAALPATIVIPGQGNSTVADNSSSSTKKIPVADNKGTQVSGGDVSTTAGAAPIAGRQQTYTTEHWVYINKSNGTFRLMGVTAATPAAAAAVSDAPVQAAVSRAK